MGFSLPERGPGRSGRHAARPRKRRRRGGKATLGVTLAIAVAAGAVRAAPYLRRHGISVPNIPHPIQLAVLLLACVYVAGLVVLLVLAIFTAGKPSHDRYVNLMLHWTYVFVAPYVIVKRRALPNHYFGREGQHRSGRPLKSEPERGVPDSITLEQYRDALRAAMGQLPDRSSVTPDQYRRALHVAMAQLSSVQMDRDLQQLLMQQLEALEKRGSADEDAPDSSQ